MTATVANPAAQPSISVIRTALAVLLVISGIAWITYYTVVFDPIAFPPPENPKPTWMGDLGKWNYLIGFGDFFLGLIVASHKRTPLGRGRGVVIGMLACFLLGLAWIVVYYFTANTADVPVMTDLSQYNLVVGVGFMAAGFVYATKWE